MHINWFWQKTSRVRCLDGSVRDVYKNLDDAAPLYIKGLSVGVDANVKSLSTLSAAAKAKYESQIRGVMYGINEHNQSLMMSFRAVYLVYRGNPCGSDAFLQREVEKLLDEQRKIVALGIQLNTLIQLASSKTPDSTAIVKIFGEIASRLGGPASASAAAFEIQDARNAVRHLVSRD